MDNQVYVTFEFDNGYLIMKCKSRKSFYCVLFYLTLDGINFEYIKFTGSFIIKMCV